MAIGERIHFFRLLRGMTQKYLGMALGFPEKSADVRLAQYETGSRTPKADLTAALAQVLDVSPHALSVPDIDSYVGLMHTLPIRREGLFLTNFLSGLSMTLIPYAVTGVLCVVVSLCGGAFDAKGLAVTVLAVLGESFFYFSSATFVAFITGNAFTMPPLYALLHFLSLIHI